MRLALAGKWGWGRAGGALLEEGWAAADSLAKRFARPSMPKPLAKVFRVCRRDGCMIISMVAG